MKRCVIALTGLSGVGKSTLLRTIAEHVKFTYVSASTLIKGAREKAASAPVQQDGLRYVDLDENQRLLLRGFQDEVCDDSQHVIFDSHTLIERGSDHSLISPSVFEAIGISAMFFLHDDPEKIVQRRTVDTTRTRPSRSTGEIQRIQEDALSHAKAICKELDIALIRISPGESDLLIDHLNRLKPK